MTLKELKSYFTEELSGLYPSEEMQSFFNILSEFFLKYTRFETVLKETEIISEENQQHFQNAITRLKQFEPIQYITGETEFYGLTFKVNQHTLIPRPETEELVSWVLEKLGNRPQHVSHEILDIGTGSGCIAISLAKNLSQANVSALDFSSDALQMAKLNAQTNCVPVDFFDMNILQAKKLPKIYDVIVSNPPYVRELEKDMMQPNVLSFEPHVALFVSDADPLLFYRKIAQLATQYLSPNGHLFFEINEYLSVSLTHLLESLGFKNIEMKQDIFGKDRMMVCTLR